MTEKPNCLRTITIRIDQTTQSVPQYSRLSKHIVLPAQCMRLFQTDINAANGEDWVVSRKVNRRVALRCTSAAECNGACVDIFGLIQEIYNSLSASPHS